MSQGNYEHILFRLPKYGAPFYLTPMHELHSATEDFYKKLHSFPSSFFTNIAAPVGIREIKDHLGTCFNLHTEEKASLDTSFQGNKSFLKAIIKSNIFLN